MSSTRPVNSGSLQPVLPDIEPSHQGSSVGLARLQPAAAAAGSLPLAGRVVAVQSPEERILAELQRESDFTPLKLCLLQFRDLNNRPAEYLQRVSDWMRDLHSKTMERKNKSTAPPNLRELRRLQEDIMTANLKKVGKLWGKSGHCFVSADQVRGWLRLYSEEFRAKLVSPPFCANLGEFCTFIPPEVAQLVWTDETWGQIAEGTFSWATGRINEALFQEIATWKGQSMGGEMVARCFATLARHLRSVQSPFLLYFCSLLAERPPHSLSFDQWERIGETMVSLIVEKRLQIQAFIQLFSARSEAFSRNWGEFAVRVCRSYSNSTTHEERAYLTQLVRVFFSELDRIPPQALVEGFSALTLSLREPDESLLLFFISIFEQQRPDFFTTEEWKSIGETALAAGSKRGLDSSRLSRRGAEAIERLFSARRAAFGRNWGEFAVRVCRSYADSTTHEERAYLAQLVRLFFSELHRISSQQLVEGFSTLTLSLRESDELLLLFFMSIFEQQRPDFFTTEEWKSIGETALAAGPTRCPTIWGRKFDEFRPRDSDPLSRLGAEAVARLFARQKSAFYPCWGGLLAYACQLYNGSISLQPYYGGMVKLFLSEPEQVSDGHLALCWPNLLFSPYLEDSILKCYTKGLAGRPLEPALQQQLASMFIERMAGGVDERVVAPILDLEISDETFLRYIQRHPLGVRIQILRVLNQYRPGHFEHDVAVNQATLEAGGERPADPYPANDSASDPCMYGCM